MYEKLTDKMMSVEAEEMELTVHMYNHPQQSTNDLTILLKAHDKTLFYSTYEVIEDIMDGYEVAVEALEEAAKNLQK